MLVYGMYESFVSQMLYVCVLCAFCGSTLCCILHDFPFVDAGQGWRRHWIQSRSHDCLIGVPFCLLHPVTGPNNK